jgi:AcrR family transcriptional regulator
MAEPATPRPLRADARRNRARLLEAAETVLAAEGVSAPVEAIARRAGVGIGTVYRHFPTKEALLEAILVGRVERLAEAADSLSRAQDAGAAFFELFARIVEEAAAKRAFADVLARAGVDVKAATSAVGQELRRAFGTLLTRAQQAGAVRDDVNLDQVMAVLVGVCLAAEQGYLHRGLQAPALAVVFDGLRPAGSR